MLFFAFCLLRREELGHYNHCIYAIFVIPLSAYLEAGDLYAQIFDIYSPTNLLIHTTYH